MAVALSSFLWLSQSFVGVYEYRQFHTWKDYIIKLHCLDVKPVISGIPSHSTDLVNSCCIQYSYCVNLSFEIMFV